MTLPNGIAAIYTYDGTSCLAGISKRTSIVLNRFCVCYRGGISVSRPFGYPIARSRIAVPPLQ